MQLRPLKALHTLSYTTGSRQVQLAKVAPDRLYRNHLSFLSKISLRQNMTKRFVLNMKFFTNRIGFAASMENIS